MKEVIYNEQTKQYTIITKSDNLNEMTNVWHIYGRVKVENEKHYFYLVDVIYLDLGCLKDELYLRTLNDFLFYYREWSYEKESNSLVLGNTKIDIDTINTVVITEEKRDYGIECLDWNEINTKDYIRYLRNYINHKYDLITEIYSSEELVTTKETAIDYLKRSLNRHIESPFEICSSRADDLYTIKERLIDIISNDYLRDYFDIYYMQVLQYTQNEKDVLGLIVKVRYKIERI